jgi:hypothetical protein
MSLRRAAFHPLLYASISLGKGFPTLFLLRTTKNRLFAYLFINSKGKWQAISSLYHPSEIISLFSENYPWGSYYACL